MPYCRAIILALLLAPTAFADDVLRTLDNKTVSGNLVGITEKDVSIKTPEGVVRTPLENVIALDLRPIKGMASGTAFHEIRLVDDTALLCSEYSIKGKVIQAKLLSGQAISIPLASIASVLRGAEDVKLLKAFHGLLDSKVKRDRIVIYKAGNVNDLEGTIGEADAEGTKIKFISEAGPIDVPLANLQGLIFYRPDGAGPVNPVCLVYDTLGNAIAALKVTVEDKKTTIVTTIPGVKIECDTASLAKFDYNMGKLSFLSDLVPTKVIETSGIGLVVAYRKDMNLDGDPIVLDRPYPKGLSLHAHTELEYDLKGKYKKFSAVLGIDPRVGGEAQPKVTIQVDGRTVYSEVVNAAKPPVPISIDVTKASTLRIIVSSQNFLDLHDHVTIANPKVTQ